MNTWITGALAVVLLVAGTPALADEPGMLLAADQPGEAEDTYDDADQDRLRDQDQLRDRDRDVTRIAEGLGKEAGMTAREEVRLQNRVQQHLTLGGDENNLKQMTRTALNEGCRGECLNSAIRYMNQAMHQAGQGPVAAREMVSEELRQAAREGDAAGLTSRFEQRMEARIGPAPRQWRDDGGRGRDDGGGMGGMGGMGGGGGRR